ncbi:lipase maturation factor 1-like [Sycon ciliatum]|uniref:lipase maturation factor 1-like n=1 Tax=Sycon ciliatum TaxID=27933 RepID=UPI0031F6B057
MARGVSEEEFDAARPRRRKPTERVDQDRCTPVKPSARESSGSTPHGAPNRNQPSLEKLAGEFWLTRIVFLRLLGLIYFVAFLVALHQNRQLIGKRGLLPADLYLKRVLDHFGELNYNAVSAAPTVLWFFNWQHDIDYLLDQLALCGLLVSALVMLRGAANMPMMALLWVLYHSIVAVGQTWYSFGWESQLLETGFLAIFLVPVWSWRRFPDSCPTPWVARWGYRWLLFRIMLGAGLIKVRGDQCWHDLTCMNYHYETQPVPNPLSYYYHQSPQVVHQFETASNHVVELICPFLLLLPFRRLCALGGLVQLLFQIVLISSGNLSFLNWLTLIPSVFCFDDATLSFLFPASTLRERQRTLAKNRKGVGYYSRQVVSLAVAGLIAYLSVPVVQNLLSARQAMNTSFEPLRIVNTYGAFGRYSPVPCVCPITVDCHMCCSRAWKHRQHLLCFPEYSARFRCATSSSKL